MTEFSRRVFLRSSACGAAGMLLSGTTALAVESASTHQPLLAKARAALELHGSRIPHRDIMAIADFSAPSRVPRFHFLNLENGQSTTFLVAHGRGSDPAHTGWVQHFSNLPGSEASAAGSYVTGGTYVGQHGESRRLVGLDAENDQAENRAIVIHAAWYVNASTAQEQGKIGRSQGCFAVSQGDIGEVLARLGSGRLLYADKA